MNVAYPIKWPLTFRPANLTWPRTSLFVGGTDLQPLSQFHYLTLLGVKADTDNNVTKRDFCLAVVQTLLRLLKVERSLTYRWETHLPRCRTSVLLSVLSQQLNY